LFLPTILTPSAKFNNAHCVKKNRMQLLRRKRVGIKEWESAVTIVGPLSGTSEFSLRKLGYGYNNSIGHIVEIVGVLVTVLS